MISFQINKRRRFIITSVLLSLGFIGIQFLENQYRFLAIGGLGLATLLLFIWSLREGLGLNLTLLTLVLPVFFTVGVGLFWFLLPVNIFARLPAVVFYGLGIYALCLTTNIYTVAAIRTIALLRAARGVGFVLTLVTSFLIYDAILSLKATVPITVLATSLISYPLFWQGYWAIPLKTNFHKELFMISAISSIVIGQIAIEASTLFFVPVGYIKLYHSPFGYSSATSLFVIP